MKIEDLLQHPDIGPLWRPQDVIVVKGTKAKPTLRIAGTAHHLLVEINGEAWAIRQDDSPFAPRPDRD